MLRSVHMSDRMTGSFATIGTMPELDEEATVLIMDSSGGISELVLEMCDVMDLTMVRVADAAGLRGNLWSRQPVGVLCDTTRFAPGSTESVLKLVADYDRSLPLLLIADDHPREQGEIDAVAEICRLTHVTRLGAIPSPFEIVAFMFEAGRLCGRGNVLPM